VNMDWRINIEAVCLVFFSLTISLCAATSQEIRTRFVTGKFVTTSHTTLQPYSQIQCVDRCFREARNGRCSVAGYNKTAQYCYLSIDSQQDLVDNADLSVGVFYVHQDTTGRTVLFSKLIHVNTVAY